MWVLQPLPQVSGEDGQVTKGENGCNKGGGDLALLNVHLIQVSVKMEDLLTAKEETKAASH